MRRITKRNLKQVVSVASTIAVAGAVYLMTAAAQGREGYVGAVSAIAVMISIVSLTYLIFAVAGYRITGDEIVNAPRWLAWTVVMLLTIAGIVALLVVADLSVSQ